MISPLVTLLVLAVLIYVVQLVISMFTLPPQLKTIINIIIALIVIFYLLSLFGLYSIPLKLR